MVANPPIRGVLFDKDGTLFDFQKSWAPINLTAARLASGGDAALAARLLLAVGVDPTTGCAAPDSLLAAGDAAAIVEAWMRNGCALSPRELVVALDGLFVDGAAHMVPAADVPAVLGRLAARGLKLGVASSDSAAGVAAAAERFGYAAMLDFACGYDSGHGRKPSAGMALAFCRAVGLAPCEIAVVGDTAHDMEMGRRAGVGLRIGVLTGAGTRQTLGPFADLVIGSIAELEAALGFAPDEALARREPPR